MGFWERLMKKRHYNTIEYCRRCQANLTMQKGYSNQLHFWKCLGCGELLINPKVNAPDDIVWMCDQCEELLNIQPGFTDDQPKWQCTECGFSNTIDKDAVYLSDDEYLQDLNNPYRGMSDQDVIELSKYEEIQPIDSRPDVLLIKNIDTDKLYVKKILVTYDLSVYEYLKENPVKNMPRIEGIYKGNRHLIIIEEYIEGELLSSLINNGPLSNSEAIDITRQLTVILNNLHSMEHPIIHRDVKPSNVIITRDGEVYLLDVNVAKLFKEEEIEDTRLLGTPHYAAPEQFGYGWRASSSKADIYSLGILFNIMVTGKLPKEEKAPAPIWDIVHKCISMEPDERYSASELMAALDAIQASK